MTGRTENEIKGEQKVERLIDGQPEFIKFYNLSLSSMSYRTKIRYIEVALKYLKYVHSLGIDETNVDNLTYDTCLAYMDKCKRKEEDGSATTIAYQRLQYSSLKKFFEYLVNSDRIKSNPMNKIQRAKGKDDVKRIYMDQDNIHLMINRIKYSDGKFKTRDMAIVYVLLQTGMRGTALTEINMENVTFEKIAEYKELEPDNVKSATIHAVDKESIADDYYLGESGARNLVFWIQDRQKYLDKLHKESNVLFINDDCNRLTISGLERIVKKYAPVVDGKQISVHKLRATFGTNLYQQTHDIYYVQQMMHHASADTTQKYIVDSNASKKKATDIMSSLMD